VFAWTVHLSAIKESDVMGGDREQLFCFQTDGCKQTHTHTHTALDAIYYPDTMRK